MKTRVFSRESSR